MGKRLESRQGGKMVFALLLSKALALSSIERLKGLFQSHIAGKWVSHPILWFHIL